MQESGTAAIELHESFGLATDEDLEYRWGSSPNPKRIKSDETITTQINRF